MLQGCHTDCCLGRLGMYLSPLSSVSSAHKSPGVRIWWLRNASARKLSDPLQDPPSIKSLNSDWNRCCSQKEARLLGSFLVCGHWMYLCVGKNDSKGPHCKMCHQLGLVSVLISRQIYVSRGKDQRFKGKWVNLQVWSSLPRCNEDVLLLPWWRKRGEGKQIQGLVWWAGIDKAIFKSLLDYRWVAGPRKLSYSHVLTGVYHPAPVENNRDCMWRFICLVIKDLDIFVEQSFRLWMFQILKRTANFYVKCRADTQNQCQRAWSGQAVG